MSNRYMYLCVLIIVTLALWLLVDYPLVGQVLIAGYAIYALWRSVKTQSVLRLALGALAVVFVATVLLNERAASAFAGYAFSLFIASSIMLSREVWHQSNAVREQRKEDTA